MATQPSPIGPLFLSLSLVFSLAFSPLFLSLVLIACSPNTAPYLSTTRPGERPAVRGQNVLALARNLARHTEVAEVATEASRVVAVAVVIHKLIVTAIIDD